MEDMLDIQYMLEALCSVCVLLRPWLFILGADSRGGYYAYAKWDGEAGQGCRGRPASSRKDAQEIPDIQYMLDTKQGRGVVRANEQAFPLPPLARYGGGRSNRGGEQEGGEGAGSIHKGCRPLACPSRIGWAGQGTGQGWDILCIRYTLEIMC